MTRLAAVLAVLLPFVLAPSLVAKETEGPRTEARSTKDLDLRGVPRLRAPEPTETLRSAPFRLRGRSGWVVRLPLRDTRTSSSEERVSNIPSPTVVDGLVVAGAGFDAWQIHAFRAGTGEHAWSVGLEDNGPSFLAVTPGRIVVNTESCTTYGIDPRRGALTWSRRLGPHVMGAPTIVGSRVYVAHDTDDHDHLLTAMRLEDGAVVWQSSLTSDILGAPVHRDGRLYVAGRDHSLACFDLDGRPFWFGRPGATSAPWLAPHGLFVAEGGVWRKGPPGVRRMDPRTGRTLWKIDTERKLVDRRWEIERFRKSNHVVRLKGGWAADAPRPVVLGDRCVVAGGRELLVLDADTGDLERRMRLPEGRRFHSPPAVLERRLLFATLEGLLVEIDPRTGAVRRALDLNRRVSGQPVVANGMAYVAAGPELIAVPWGERSGPSWPQWGGGNDRLGASSRRGH